MRGLLLGCLLCCAAAAAAERRPAVYLGGVGPGYALLAEPAVAAPLRAAGVGLYQHANGNAGLSAAQRDQARAVWGAPVLGEVGPFVPVPAGYRALFGERYPAVVTMNIEAGTGRHLAGQGEMRPGRAYGGWLAPGESAAAAAAIDAARGAGASVVAPFLTPNGGAEDLDDPFATGPFWAPARALAVHGGGIALDVPPSYAAERGAAYVGMVRQMLAWARAEHLRSSLVVSPYAVRADGAGHTGNCGYDPAFMANTRRLVAALGTARPSEWVVESYGLAGPGCGTSNDVSRDGAPGSLNAVALYLAREAGR